MSIVNIKQIKTDIKETAVKIRELKAILRESGQPRLTWQIRGELWRLKEHATILCALRAHLRGKLHLPQKMNATQQAEFVAKLLTKYEEKPIVEESALARQDERLNEPNRRDFEYRRAPNFFARLGAAFRELMSA